MFEWKWDGTFESWPDIEDLNSEFGKTVVGITYLRSIDVVNAGPMEANGNEFEDSLAIAFLCSKMEELSPGLIAECIKMGIEDLISRGIVVRKH